MMPPRSLTLALTGASGLPYGLRLLDCLLDHDLEVRLLYSQAAQIVAQQELGLRLASRPDEARTALLAWLQRPDDARLRVFGREEWFAPVASGSNPSDAMVICPCTTGTLAAIAHGLSDNLIERAADVSLKEGRKLVLVPRETPLSVIHLENMLTLARAGAVILPPAPGFYTHPRTVADMVDFVVARILDQLGLPHQLQPRWGEPE
ncbi:UbiX family flavin prenyltransferase [Laribacter hongkongensis]|uniref:Flavin prenyltransferase UbiX n=1 Tax=Laribacter hongkongensis TaxID=168471 RepID=A0AAW5DE92_9NEIS|nr:flavin prenyltransferase UbiX [Laribacter hongkongensis]MCG8995123.1 UbiX family flavin prenyltransferase [Laribacter hongkongensis]MCG9010205.1 UbiX family flavin prenyltransferase [Laribacter hongkongensis]MCG9021650.1 UbiX family flavin prenyltransferase [Laribacter hongkongensis]MCG9026289.1 UbiX family flavin prenyltransferase [Laribacter hongkongensis]MCG9047015.1 UbiX family flavin prenyltransferase [Laribacter hongkongensis]